MPGKNDYKHGFKAKAEKIGISVRRDLNLSEKDPLDATLLAKRLQIPIVTIDQAFEDCFDSPAYKILTADDQFNALLMSDADQNKMIIHNNRHSLKRQQSNLMHELAHALLDHDINLEFARIARQYAIKYVNESQEQEAGFLGGCLQICRPALLWAVQTMTESEISDYFMASREMVKYRLGVTGVLKQIKSRTHF